jgi:hypothetical protein
MEAVYMFGIGKKTIVDPKMDNDTAALELEGIIEEFDIDIDDEKRAELLPAVMQGRLYLEGDKIVYKLARPTEKLTELKFEEPTGAQAEKSGRGIKATQRDGVTEIDIGEASKMTTNLASAMSGVPIAQILELRSRDSKIVEMVVNFFK